jgi:quercetin dioxygenase-like cupin family protein
MLVDASTAPTYDLPFLRVTGLAAPSRGAASTCVWRLTIAPGAPGAEHSVDKEEIFVALAGQATATVAGRVLTLRAGDALIVPAGTAFALGNPGPEPFEAVAVLPVGAEARLPGGERLTPPWTL